MKFSEQKAVVNRLRALSVAKSAELEGHRQALNSWKRERLGSPGSLALFFAAGVLWGSSKKDPDSAAGKSTVRRKVASTANAAFLVSRLFTSPISVVTP
ncbi:MAG: hypothetical protein RIA65_17560 [Woeseia sp.]